ncbi:hypothetical protein [Streptomyces sp. NPDC057545]|uniref:hypothetical protein n=1 Tax=Streptomyces sp. NPDC057545 TaxID=3346164 RepID=UPI00368FFFD5
MKETVFVLDALEMALWQRDRDQRPVRQGELSRYLQNLIAIKTGGPVGVTLLNPEDHARPYEQVTDLTSAGRATR